MKRTINKELPNLTLGDNTNYAHNFKKLQFLPIEKRSDRIAVQVKINFSKFFFILKLF